MVHLHYKAYGHSGFPVIVLHGLLGMLDNWQTQCKRLAEHHFKVYALDQRNHGKSPHSDTFNYKVMAEDVRQFMHEHYLASAHVLGHSMGGKTAMQFALAYPELVAKLVVVDVAPRRYPAAHDEILEAMSALRLHGLASRQQADDEIASRIPDFALRQFILKNLMRTEEGEFKWKVNLSIIRKHYHEIADDISAASQFPRPVLFVKGSRSSYIVPGDESRIHELFPLAKIVTIQGTGHWVHADKPLQFGDAVLKFLQSP